MKGAKPVPRALNVIRGNPGKRKLQPEATDKSFRDLSEADIPKHVRERRELLTIWSEIVGNCPPGLLKRTDAKLIETLVVANWVHRQALQKMPTANSLISRRKDGGAMPNPLLSIVTRQSAIIRLCCESLGFTPTSRNRVHVSDGAKDPTWGNITANKLVN